MLIGYEGAFTATQSTVETPETIHRRECPTDAWWFQYRWHVLYLGWTQSPRPADVVAVEETIARREFPRDRWWFDPRRTPDQQGWTRGPIEVEREESIHRREFPNELRRGTDLGYFGFQRGPISEDFVEAQESIRRREYPTDAFWFTPRQLPHVWHWSPLPGNVEPQNGQTIIVEPLAGCGSNLWRAYKRYVEDNFTWTRAPFETGVVEDRIVRGEFPADAWWFAHRENVRPHGGWTAAPQVSHWCEVGAAVLFTSANWGGGVLIFFEAYLRAVSGLARARLFNKTDNAVVPGSEVSTTSGLRTRVRSGALTLVDGKEYVTQIGAETGVDATEIFSSRWIAA